MDIYEYPASLKLVKTEQRGRGFYATKQLSKGTTLIKSQPLVSIFDLKNIKVYCHTCGKSENVQLKQCTGCRVSVFCSVACQRAAWTLKDHKLECAALKRWAANHPSDRSIPDTPIRALAKLLWMKADPSSPESNWQQVKQLQSHRASLDQTTLQYYASLAVQLADYIGRDHVTSMEGPTELLDFCCAFASNSFTLTLPDLSPVGVAISPLVALFNHSCWPNAVVVFPHGPKVTSSMHVVLIEDVKPGEEILTSYIDISNPLRIRQTELLERYHFTCDCVLCEKPRTEPDWVDPREALACLTASCDGWARLPDLSLDGTEVVTCTKCHHTWTVSVPELAEEMRVGERLLASFEDADPAGLSSHVKTCLESLGNNLFCASHFLFALLRTAQLVYIEDGLIKEAALVGQTVSQAMLYLYPVTHPVVAVQMVTLAKLVLHLTRDDNVKMLSEIRDMVTDSIRRLRVCFGKKSGVELQAQDMLDELTRALALQQH